MSEQIGYVSKKYPYTTFMEWEFYRHKHSFWEIIICIKGKAVHTINDNKYDFEKYDVIVMKPGNTHDYKIVTKDNYLHNDFYVSSEDLKRMCDGLSPKLYARLATDNSPLAFKITDAVLNVLYEKLSTLNTIQQQPLSKDMTEILYRTILTFLCGLIAENIEAQDKNIPDWLSRLLSIMSSSEHIGDNVSDIAAMSGFSHGHLCRLFKKHTGETLENYFTTLKMNYANVLLKNKEKRILDISSFLGYESLSHFIRVFKKYNNATPKQYRKLLYGE